jgi:6-methylsalicylate decarboxylase
MTEAPHRIDVHHHIVPPEYVQALAGIGVTNSIGAAFPQWDADTTLEVMDRNGIQSAITSISCPGVFFGDKGFAVMLARLCNEISARLITDYPGRFGAFATLPLPDTDAALKELEYAIETLKLDGVVLLTNYTGTYLGDPAFEVLFQELNRRRTPVFVHPADPPGGNALGGHVPNFLFLKWLSIRPARL